MDKSFRIGDRVRIAETYAWAKGAVGTVRQVPSYIRKFVESPEAGGSWRDEHRIIESLDGTIISYWIEFDSPQLDWDGAGPYIAGEVDARYLQPLSEEFADTP